MPTPNGPKNQPRYDVNDEPAFADHLTEVSEFAAANGNWKVGTKANRTALTGNDLWDGLHFYETDTAVTYRRVSGAWVLATAVSPRLRMQRPAAAGISATTWQAVGMTGTIAQEGGGGYTSSGSSFQVPVTGRYGVNEKCATPTTTTGARRMLGIATSAGVSTPLVQSGGMGAANDNSGFGIDFYTEMTLQAGTQYVVVAYSTNPLNFTNFDISVRLIAPTTIG